MKRWLLPLILLLAPVAFGQGTTSLTANPLGGNIVASSAACATVSSCVWMKLPPTAGTESVTITGTFSETLVYECSGDGGVTWTTLATLTATGVTAYNVSAMTDCRVRASAFVSGNAGINLQASAATAPGSSTPGAAGSVSVANIAGTTDPCDNPSVLKSSVPINVVTPTTTSLVAVSGTKAVYVCGFTVTIAPSATSADTAQLEYGTGAACSSPTVLTGSFGAGDVTTATGPTVISLADPGTSMTAPASNGVCLLSAGTTVNIQGILQYVQQ
jgi:hypothetical protein